MKARLRAVASHGFGLALAAACASAPGAPVSEIAALEGGFFVTRFDGRPLQHEETVLRVYRADASVVTPSGGTLNEDADGVLQVDQAGCLHQNRYLYVRAADGDPGRFDVLGEMDVIRVTIGQGAAMRRRCRPVADELDAMIAALEGGFTATRSAGGTVRLKGDGTILAEPMP